MVATVATAGLLAVILAIGMGMLTIAIVVGLVGLGAAGVTLIGRRWTPVAASIYGLLAAFLVIGPSPEDVTTALAQPADLRSWLLVLFFPLLVLGFTAGAAASMQNMRGVPGIRPRPKWLVAWAACLLGVSIGGILVAGVPRPAATQFVSPAVMVTLPVLQAADFAFNQTELHVHAGETVALHLENADAVTHTFTLDEFGVDSAIAPGKDGVAVFRPTQPGTYTYYCRPHYDRATGEGMHGTLVVE